MKYIPRCLFLEFHKTRSDFGGSMAMACLYCQNSTLQIERLRFLNQATNRAESEFTIANRASFIQEKFSNQSTKIQIGQLVLKMSSMFVMISVIEDTEYYTSIA